jgi:predicted DCC family thiol-disulfide oxidoreductase YuxK
MVVIYDGNCRFCARAVNWLVRLVGVERVEVLAGGDASRERFAVDAGDAMYVVAEGALYRGYWAFRYAFAASRALRPLAVLMSLPPVAAAGERIYGWIASRRSSFGCGATSCVR